MQNNKIWATIDLMIFNLTYGIMYLDGILAFAYSIQNNFYTLIIRSITTYDEIFTKLLLKHNMYFEIYRLKL